ncbi:Gmad2 immunoglobulin-like domain-containing protein [Nocardioides sp.]|uniref:Gmad2 immunoglobulin-like domain-containing protein n=1 Tax=Nocardioides sp. TaxID=35761 RepID=UPI0027187DF1|nr:Gmad2 immunoglobulin-like domain-containing protein [Nocardioides sp.]MDO9458105.1 Gmad2 immunoglobulin-like domain-containing protein [Nocardioides sp.]
MNTRTSLAVLALSGVLATGLTACGDDEPEPVSSETGSDAAATTTEAPTTTPTEPTSSPSESESTPDAGAAPVYFTGDTPLGARLYREFRQVEADNPLEEAAALLVAGDALDPDSGTLLGGVTIDTVTQDDAAIVVTLGEDSILKAGKGTSAEDASLAVQSLVYTLQGVAQARVPVRVVLADGTPTDLFGQPTAEGVTAAPELDVLALVNLTTPEEGATASGTLDVEGVASSFEATVPYAVLDEAGKEVVSDFSTAEGWVDKLYPFTAEVDISALAPGTYTFVARTDDPSGGEGPGAFEDTKTFTVG